MASKSAGKQQQKDVDSLITCAICLDYFVDPRILPCSHTYCLECIRNIALANLGQFECPMRDGTNIERDRIDSLPINRAVRDMVEVLSHAVDGTGQTRQSFLPQCDECQSTEADFWCIDCAISCCTTCSIAIHKRALAQHRRVPISEKPIEIKRCSQHHDEKLKYWCSCEKLICMDCQLSKQHKDHVAVPISEVIPGITEQLKTEFKEAQTSLSQAIAQNMPLTDMNENTNIQSITQTFDALHLMMDNFEKALKNQICIIEEKNKTLTESYLQQLILKQTIFSDHNRKFENILSTNDQMQLLEDKNSLTNYLQQLMTELRELKLSIKTGYRIEGVDQLQTSINNILKQARIVELVPENQRFAVPGTYQQLLCQGRPCAKCGKCVDWYYTGDSASWNWIRKIETWTNDDWQRSNNDRVYDRFIRRDHATCRGTGARARLGRHSHGAHRVVRHTSSFDYGLIISDEDDFNMLYSLTLNQQVIPDPSQSNSRICVYLIAAQRAAYPKIIPVSFNGNTTCLWESVEGRGENFWIL
ncbi:unnamed protein product [Adineta steineri]|uniref:Uncharacterized protein n=1 Tax=Adineta steineri TaxID=433720 RepID=A0A819SBP9_9BILA|nr:unnamed protein product [Adineta steineri]CAF4049922.1 unnamed protein product [Adineta steineri]